MNLFDDIKLLVLDSLDALTRDGILPEGLELAQVNVEPPRDPAHGDMATNAAMVLAKPAGCKPRDIAEALVARLSADPRIALAEVAGPGFINLRLADDVWQAVVARILTPRDRCTWATPAGRCSAMRWPTCWPMPGMT